ncbi:MAG TPA: TetR/AcrR family transcriptional regulator [Candidatus Izemoplasmatales bacterium]|nr:TetR/AcrR family transcriptional regulator [Candidatus Izemoplasmatales bacterium]
MQKNKNIKVKIINTAKQLLKMKGSFTIKDIAEACYINIAAVNYHFGSKENLLNIVSQEIIDEIKTIISNNIRDLPKDISDEETVENIINLVYSFAIENMGIINYLFLNDDYQDENANILIREFFTDSPFTRQIYEKIAESTATSDSETIKVKYLLIFSSFAIPLFIQVLGQKSQSDILSLKAPGFRRKYIKELLNILYVERK